MIDSQKYHPVKKSKRSPLGTGVLFGVLAGAGFSAACWGVDAVQLAQAHAMAPFLKLAMGGIPSILAGALVGVIVACFDRLWVNMLSVSLAGILFGWLAAHIPTHGVALALERLDPATMRMLAYPFDRGMQTRQFLILFVTTGIALLSSPFLSGWIERSYHTIAPLGKLLPILLWTALFIGMGWGVDSLINQPMRAPLLLINQTMQFVLDHENKTVDRIQSAELSLGAVAPVRDLLHKPRRMILSEYDIPLETMVVLVDFDGVWARCSVFSGSPGTCKLLTEQ
jgi:hypothetical protein